jgi:hypothetical protein
LQATIAKEIRDFDKRASAYKVIIVDICNENGPSTQCFGIDTIALGYQSFNYYPNLDKTKIDDYQCWCLRNVLNRPNCTERDNFWLNPVSAGVSTCIRVHNMKFAGIKNLLGLSTRMVFNESWQNLAAMMDLIREGADSYAEYLATQRQDEIILAFLKSTGFPIRD